MKKTKPIYWTIVRIAAVIELCIGLTAILGLTFYSIFFISRKPLPVFIFVIISSIISIVLGYGIIKFREWARHLLVFFSGYVIFTKILIFMKLLAFTGEIITIPSPWLKDSISLVYHVLLITLLENKVVKEEFKKHLVEKSREV